MMPRRHPIRRGVLWGAATSSGRRGLRSGPGAGGNLRWWSAGAYPPRQVRLHSAGAHPRLWQNMFIKHDKRERDVNKSVHDDYDGNASDIFNSCDHDLHGNDNNPNVGSIDYYSNDQPRCTTKRARRPRRQRPARRLPLARPPHVLDHDDVDPKDNPVIHLMFDVDSVDRGGVNHGINDKPDVNRLHKRTTVFFITHFDSEVEYGSCGFVEGFRCPDVRVPVRSTFSHRRHAPEFRGPHCYGPGDGRG